MNANELAYELYDLDVQASQQSLNDWAEQAASMLHKQHADLEHMWMANTVLEVEIEALKAHPVKELTDEEIIAVGNAVVNHIDSNEGWIEFARAILRKAQK